MKYSVESLEFLKEKANITYDEAVELLKKYEGDVALAIVELEKQGRLKSETTAKAAKTKNKTEAKKCGIGRLFRKLMAHRLVVKKEEMVIANISWLFIIISVCTAPWLVIFAFVLSLVLGYKYSRSVNWSMAGDEIKDFGHKAVETFKDLTSKVLEEEPVPANNSAANKNAAKTTGPEKKTGEITVKEAEQLAAEVIEKKDGSLEISEIIIEP